MDRIAIGLGGHPLLGDNVEFTQSAWRNAFEGLLSPLANTIDASGKISGCAIVVAGSNYTYGAGWAWYNNEVYYVPAQATPQPLSLAPGATYAFDFIETVAQSDQYQDLTTQNVHYVRTATIVHNALGVHEINSLMQYEDVLSDLLITTGKLTTPTALNAAVATLNASIALKADKTIDTWHVVGSGGGNPAYGTGMAAAAGRDTRYIKDDVGGVHVRIAVTSSGTDQSIFLLPVGYRPITNISVPIFKYSISSTPSPYWCTIDASNGNVFMVDPVSPFFPPAGDYYLELYFKI